MKVQKKIVISNIFMILIPIAASVVIALIISLTTGSRFFSSTDQLYKDANGIISAQNIAYAYQEEIWKDEWELPKQYDVGNLESGSESMDEDLEEEGKQLLRPQQTLELETRLAELGYNICILWDDIIVYTTLTEDDLDVLSQKGQKLIGNAENLCISSEGTSVIKTTFIKKDISYELVAVNSGKISVDKKTSYFQRYIIATIVIFFISLIFIVIITDFVLSRWLAKSIIPPLNILKKAANDIQQGELDNPVVYYRDDEFGRLCSDFEQMRLYLKESVEKQIIDEKSRKELIYGISHDMRTPLTSIIGYAQGLAVGAADTPEKMERYIKAIMLRADDIKSLLDNLILYSRLQNNDLVYNFKSHGFNDFISDYFTGHQSDMEQDGVEVEFGLSENELFVSIDEVHFGRILDNIVKNSIKYRTGEKTLISVTTKEEDNSLVFMIKDDGTGVPEDKLDKIFECFLRLDDSRTEAGESHGLGLSIVKKIVEGHKGSIEAQNREGLMFIIKLPLVN